MKKNRGNIEQKNLGKNSIFQLKFFGNI